MTLTNFTLDYLEKHWAKEIDFVICASPPLCVRTKNLIHIQGPEIVQGETTLLSSSPLHKPFLLFIHRHDNDRKLPRTPAEIYDSNLRVAERMEDIFVRRGIPVVPSLGESYFCWVVCQSLILRTLSVAVGNNDIWRECMCIYPTESLIEIAPP